MPGLLFAQTSQQPIYRPRPPVRIGQIGVGLGIATSINMCYHEGVKGKAVPSHHNQSPALHVYCIPLTRLR
jgi:hypothetical protein